MKELAIVVVAYNRVLSLKRLLHSISHIATKDLDIPLVISIDQSENQDVEKVAAEFVWSYGEKRVICRQENLGLKKHVLLCGDLTLEYGNIIMLEDDLFVSPQFYEYAKAALQFVKDQEKSIAGVSLYNHMFNVHVREPFDAIEDGFDNWYFQMASSWGQAWSQSQWKLFREWLTENETKPVAADNVPHNISSWSDKSWLKLFTKYMIETNRYFLYPRVSLTTNFSEEGAHSKRKVTDLQVPLAGIGRREYCFSTVEQSAAVYDAFFENICIADCLQLSMDEVDIDLYGYKKLTKKYAITSQILPFQIIKSFDLSLRPIEANIIQCIEGNCFRLYDTEQEAKPAGEAIDRSLYHYKGFKMRYVLPIMRQRVKERQKKL